MIRLLDHMLPSSQGSFHSQRTVTPAEADREAARREMVTVAVRDILRKQCIPRTWLTAEAVTATTARRERGLHVRLVVREWRPEWLPYTVALQKAIRARIARFDPLCGDWLTGISWRFELVDETPCPSLPSPDRRQEACRSPRTRGPADGFAPTEPMVIDRR